MNELQKPNYAQMTDFQLQRDSSPEAAHEIRRRNDMAAVQAYYGVRWRLPEPPPQA
ncbi:hypothetical protein [Sphingomonas melonis]|uniref:hypothetical protein n=1 Tax=Sphingomonas melonis TaxID=152682 RepID=UPI0036D90AD1